MKIHAIQTGTVALTKILVTRAELEFAAKVAA
jgi:hypothetical protein